MSSFFRPRLLVALAASAVALASLAFGETSGLAVNGFGSLPLAGNGLIAFVSDRDGDKEIYTVVDDGSEQTNLTNNAAADVSPAWSSNGAKLAFASDRGGDFDIFAMNADGSGVLNLTATSGVDVSPAWAPDDSRIAFSSNRGGDNDIYLMNPDGSGVVNLTNLPGSDAGPAWSPDGSRIAFSSNRGGDYDIYLMNPDGSGVVDLTNTPGTDSDAAWSPDGSKIVFTSSRDGNAEIYEMNSDGSGQTNMTNDPSPDSDPIFTPDRGARIAFTSRRNGNPEIFYMRSTDGAYPVDVIQNPASDSMASWQPLVAAPSSPTPIQHVVVMYQENHSFDNVLGLWCVRHPPCDGATQGEISDGTLVNLRKATDLVPEVTHNHKNQTTAVAGGQMNGWDLVQGCEPSTNLQCMVQFRPTQIPNLWDMATTYAVSDRTFQLAFVPSWHSHVQLVASTLDGFDPKKFPFRGEDGLGPGWGCDSFRDDHWQPTVFDPMVNEPACIPQMDGSGPYRESQVSWVPTIMDRFDEAGLAWHIYAPPSDEALGYGFSTCPTFAECLYGPQHNNVFAPEQFAVDAAAGNLPNFSLLIPQAENSQHNHYSMLQGDNWLGASVDAIMSGPDWDSTAIFILYDDCGCFYDHAAPPPNLGMRVPMVIVSPYTKPGFVDSNVASFASMLAFTEHTFGLAPLGLTDAVAYDYAGTFNYSQQPLSPIALSQHPLPKWEVKWLKDHPITSEEEEHDPYYTLVDAAGDG